MTALLPLSHGGSTHEDAPPRRFAILLRRAWQGLNQSFRLRIEHLGITPFHFTILRWLSESDPLGVSQRELVELMASDPNTVSATLARMEEYGWIFRIPHERDRRAFRVRLSMAGRAKFESARPIALTHQENVIAALPPDARERFLDDLETIADACAGLLMDKALRSAARGQQTSRLLAETGN